MQHFSDNSGFTRKEVDKPIPASKPSEQPEFIVLAGGSGVGKSTMAKVLKRIKAVNESAILITPELIKEYEPRLRKGSLVRHPEKSPENLELYYYTRDKMVIDHLQKGISIILDDHCDNLHNDRELMQKVRDIKGYEIETALLGLFLEPQEYEKRLTGKGLSLKTTKDYSFAKKNAENFSRNFPELVKLFDSSILIENSDKEKFVAAKYVCDEGKIKKFEESDRYANFAVYSESLPPPEPVEPIKGSGKHSFASRLDPREYSYSWQQVADMVLKEARSQSRV